MAEVIEKLSRLVGRTATRTWDEWTDGRVWRAEQGVDFQGTPQAFRITCYKKAKQRGKWASVCIVGKFVEFQFRPREESNGNGKHTAAPKKKGRKPA